MGENDDSDDALAAVFRETANAIERDKSGEPVTSPRLLSIKEAAKRTNLTRPTLRFYEKIGLLDPPARSAGRFRKYGQQDIERLERVKQLRDLLGFSLTDIQELLKVDKERERLLTHVRAHWGAPTDSAQKEEWMREAMSLNQKQLADVNKQLRAVEAKIEGLQSLRAEILQRIERIERIDAARREVENSAIRAEAPDDESQ